MYDVSKSGSTHRVGRRPIPSWISITRLRPFFCSVLILVLFIGSTSQLSSGYSVLTHEQIVDLLWADQIRPLLLKKYPGATEEQLREAHAYAYGGSLIQDIGYYPFGNRHFSDLVHYVRSGDFVVALLDEASDLDEYAFALGALSHYASDLAGHPYVNTAVAREFPKLAAKYGPRVTFGEDARSHIRTEFGFDLIQIAKQRYTSDSYHDFIGFQVAKPVLERAFLKTYGIELKDVFMNLDLSIGSYRYSISHIIPKMTRIALKLKEPDLIKEKPSFDKMKFLYNLSRAQYERDWGKGYQKPGFGSQLLGVPFRILPGIGPFKAIKFQVPTRETEAMYEKSVNDTVDQYRILLQQLKTREIALPNRNLDTGGPTEAGEYAMTNHAYAKLVGQLVDSKFAGLTPELQKNIVHFYADRTRVIAKKKDREEWQKALLDVEQLKLATVKEAALTEAVH